MQELRLLRCPNDGDIGTLGVYRVIPAKLQRPVHAKGHSAIMEGRSLAWLTPTTMLLSQQARNAYYVASVPSY